MSNSLLGFTSESVLNSVSWAKPTLKPVLARVILFGQKEKINKKDILDLPLEWQTRQENPAGMIQRYSGQHGPVWVLKVDLPAQKEHHGQFQVSAYASARDVVGAIYRELSAYENIYFQYVGKDEQEFSGAIVGIELSQYRFKNYWPNRSFTKKNIYCEAKSLKNAKKVFADAKKLGEATNLARHLVNLPGNVLNPSSYAQMVKELFKNSKAKVEVWDESRLKKEKMHLHAAVGQASEHPACLLHISYKNSSQKKHQAFVGKGITFDSGGLDIKPSSGMRDMKKDMGGSASIVGLAYWMVHTAQKRNAEFYLSIAENSLSQNAFRPGDIYQTRSGKSVEIHNTDAEGRLVLCDTLFLAQESQPECIIDVATLTGAIKVALGETTAGMFSNQDKLAKQLLTSAQSRGDNAWRVPLDPTQKNKLRSEVADLANAHEGFGGAVTAALFLENFVGKTPWAHFDIYSWSGSASGCLSEKGGNGQLVQCLADFCLRT